MQKECVTTVIINTVETRNLGTVLMINSMPTECVKIATLIHTTVSEGRRSWRIMRSKESSRFKRKINDFDAYVLFYYCQRIKQNIKQNYHVCLLAVDSP